MLTFGDPWHALGIIVEAIKESFAFPARRDRTPTDEEMPLSPIRPTPRTTNGIGTPELSMSVRRALEHSLSIMTAATDAQLMARTLAAATEVTGATVAVAFEPDGTRRLHGDQTLAMRLAEAAVPSEPAWCRGGPTTAFAAQGLPCAIAVVARRDPHHRGDGGRLRGRRRSLLALVVAHASAGRERLRELAQLAQRADSDPLTGLRHHRPFEERLSASLPGRTAVLAVDVDQFKRINDEYGHQAGDVALVSVAGALRSVLRGEDELYRIGGDEFAVVVDVNGAGRGRHDRPPAARGGPPGRSHDQRRRRRAHRRRDRPRDPAPGRPGAVPGQAGRPRHRPPRRLTSGARLRSRGSRAPVRRLPSSLWSLRSRRSSVQAARPETDATWVSG